MNSSRLAHHTDPAIEARRVQAEARGGCLVRGSDDEEWIEISNRVWHAGTTQDMTCMAYENYFLERGLNYQIEERNNGTV